MMIKIILISALLLILYKLLRSRHSPQVKASKKIFFILLLIAAMGSVALPEELNKLARFLNVGRGADLLVYGLAVAFIFQAINGYLATKEQHREIAKLARKVAIMEADLNNRKAR